MRKFHDIIWQRSPDRHPTPIGRVDCENIAAAVKALERDPEDPDAWPLRPGGFRETVYLLMLHG